jgi:hypothetical protein
VAFLVLGAVNYAVNSTVTTDNSNPDTTTVTTNAGAAGR